MRPLIASWDRVSLRALSDYFLTDFADPFSVLSSTSAKLDRHWFATNLSALSGTSAFQCAETCPEIRINGGFSFRHDHLTSSVRQTLPSPVNFWQTLGFLELTAKRSIVAGAQGGKCLSRIDGQARYRYLAFLDAMLGAV